MSLHDAAWLDALADLEERARAAVSAALTQACAEPAGLGIPIVGVPLEVSLVFTDDAEQRVLNRDYRHKDSATNVLSFPNMDDDLVPAGEPRLLGDVVLARETVAREAAEQGKSLADHTTHLLVHGVLHLLGHDHQDAEEAAAMEALERRILAGLGIADPYETATAEMSAPEVGHG